MANFMYLPDKQLAYTPTVAKSAGDIVIGPDGKPGMVLSDLAANQAGNIAVGGIAYVAKAANVVLLDGQEVYWSIANKTVSYSGDVSIGTARGEAASAATGMYIDLNNKPRYVIELGKTVFDTGATTASAAKTFEETKLLLTTGATAQMAAVYSRDTVDVDDKPIFEAWAAVYNIGDNAVVDFNFGLAADTHATDFDSIAQYIAFHLDGNALDILAQSKDGTTTTAATDTTVNAVDDTYAFFQIDLSDLTNPRFFINGVEVLAATAWSFAAYASTLKAIAHLEKSGTDDTPGELRLKQMTVRYAKAA